MPGSATTRHCAAGRGPHNVYGFLMTAPNAVVEPIHHKGHAGNLEDWRRSGRLDARAVG
jgi:hypothetical protein